MNQTAVVRVEWDRLCARLSRRYFISAFEPGQESDLIRFFQVAYADQPIAYLFKDEEQVARRLGWLHQGHLQDSRRGDFPVWICRKGDRIVGHFAALPATAVIRGKELPVYWGRDLIVAPEFRQQGVGPLLILSTVKAVQGPFLIAGLNETVYPIYRRLGFVDCGKLRLYLKVYRLGRLLRALKWPSPVRWAMTVAVPILQTLRTRYGRAGGLTLFPIDRFDGRFDAWWRGIEGKMRSVIRRTQNTLNWRYLNHPFHRYACFMAQKAGQIRGVVVVRHGISRGLPAGFISEFLADPGDSETMRALLEYAEGHLLSTAPTAPVFLRCVVRHPAFERALIQAGFLRAPSPIHWMWTHTQGEGALAVLGRREEWLINSGDSDLDAI